MRSLKKISPLLRATAFCTVLTACEQKVQYLDADVPGMEPKVYAEGIVNLPGRFQQNLTMTSNGNEVLITETNAERWRYERILRIKSRDGRWVTDTPKFVIDFQFENEWFIGEPMLLGDDELFFVADYPPNLWRSQRLGDGEW